MYIDVMSKSKNSKAIKTINICVRLCLPLPLSPHPYMVLPVSQSLLVQSVSALS